MLIILFSAERGDLIYLREEGVDDFILSGSTMMLMLLMMIPVMIPVMICLMIQELD